MPIIAEASAVGQVEVIAVSSDDDSHRWVTVPGQVVATWSGEEARVALALIAALPEDETMRCFNPRFGVRVRAGSTVLAEVAFCFSCHNALTFPSEHTPDLPKWFAFDPDSPPAQELLRRFRACAPTET